MSDQLSTTHDYAQARRALSSKIMERVLSDPAFREQLVENPEQAVLNAGYAEDFQRLNELAQESDVQGYAAPIDDSNACCGVTQTCGVTNY